MQVPGFTICYVRSQSAQDAGRIATGFPLPSTGRGIEGEGWSYPEPPPVSSSISPIRGPGLKLRRLKPETLNLKPSPSFDASQLAYMIRLDSRDGNN